MRTTFEQHLTHHLNPDEFFDVQTHKSNPRRFRCEILLITETGVTLRGALYTKSGQLHPSNSSNLRLSQHEFAPFTSGQFDGSHHKAHAEMDKLGIPEVFRYLIADQIRLLQTSHSKMVSET